MCNEICHAHEKEVHYRNLPYITYGYDAGSLRYLLEKLPRTKPADFLELLPNKLAPQALATWRQGVLD